ncbi:MAG TPA: hypothetical protein VGY53_11520, partial [Isosphaeraceae bacterium]|nr:hypothetical protein [Isosphaeraceae bacterium]
MRQRTKSLPKLELLETRKCPSVSAQQINGFLLVTDDQPNLSVTQIDAQTFRVQDGVSFDSTVSGITKDVGVLATTGNQAIVVNFQGNTTPHSINVQFLRSGANALRVADGT